MATPTGSGSDPTPGTRECERQTQRAGDHDDEMASPRTSFCLLEATGEDRDSVVSSSVAVHSPHGLHRPRANTTQLHPINGNATTPAAATPPAAAARRRRVSYGQTTTIRPSIPVATRSPRKTAFPSTSTVSIPPMVDHFENEGSVAIAEGDQDEDVDIDSMRGLFRVDSSVYANPDNIAPSLQTSIIMGESQIVGVNGTLASLYPGKRRQRRATDAIAMEAAGSVQSHNSLLDQFSTHRHLHQLHTGDTLESSTAGGDSPIDPSLLTGGSDDFSGVDTSIYEAQQKSGWQVLCACLSSGSPSPRTKETMTLTEFVKSLWVRMRNAWDSYFLFFTLALAILSIPIALGISAILKATSSIGFRARCQFRGTNDELYSEGVTIATLGSVVIPTINHVVLMLVSLWIAVKCSQSRKRVLKSSQSSMAATLTSAFMLPCFEVLWYTISFLNLAGVVLHAVSFFPTSVHKVPGSGSAGSSRERLRLDVNPPYPCDVVTIPFTWMLQLLPFLMAQHSVSHEAVRRAVVYSGLICMLILVLQITLFKEGHAAMGMVSICVHFMLLAFYCWAKFLSHARSSFDFFFVVAILDSITAIAVEIIILASSNFTTSSPLMIGQCVVMSLDAILTVAMLLSLRADTRYWLGIDDSNTSTRHPFKQYMRHLSERGMITNFSTRTSVYDVHRMIEEHRKSVVDFSALKLECVIAQGATSIVMRGVLRPNKPIALKIYTSVQVTDEEVRRFSRETALNVQLSHPNIVKFYGLCVVPPSISLVFEFCEYGGLDGVLRNGSMRSLSTKLRAWLDACRAVAYLHSFSPPLLHRDIKTDNFLVGQDFTLKLADFGEANLLKPRTDGTMTIAGTVDYMAPEMILGGKTARYGTGVDVYSLMITLWQIMVPDRSPWEGRSHLEVYTCVTNGERPPLLPSIPSGCAEILEAGWVANPSDRVAVEEIIPKVHQLWLLSTHQKTLKRTK